MKKINILFAFALFFFASNPCWSIGEQADSGDPDSGKCLKVFAHNGGRNYLAAEKVPQNQCGVGATAGHKWIGGTCCWPDSSGNSCADVGGVKRQ